ncbi:TPA: hypothetical protein DCR49_01335 [Candidatus Delongbacteria bacterium]|nr:MAG: hypothetical protein A2Y39_03885 [Candidatus Delongbacteria bacterium GWF2_40_14]HAQ60644.1 hypothetical protein [Candidatus Delongbacteria bacterium]
MSDIKDKIFDLVFEEIESSDEKKNILNAVEKDPELKKYYNMLKKERSLLGSGTFENVSDELLEANREKLSVSVSAESKKINFTEIFNIYGRKFLQYAAVILLTFYATMYHFSGKTNDNGPVESGIKTGAIPYQNVAVVSGESVLEGIDMSKYKVENLNIDETGDEITIDFDVSTNKVIKGSKNDPAIINTLKYLVENENNSGVKLKTMKAMNNNKDESFTKTLIKAMLEDKDPIIRRKAMKMVADQIGQKEVREALYKVVLNDGDETNRIQALSMLEESDSEYAGKAIRSASSDKSEYFRFKAEEINANDEKGR